MLITSAITAGASTAAEAPTAAGRPPAPGPGVQEAQEAQHQDQEQQGAYWLPRRAMSFLCSYTTAPSLQYFKTNIQFQFQDCFFLK